jgi:hypothetical protein
MPGSSLVPRANTTSMSLQPTAFAVGADSRAAGTVPTAITATAATRSARDLWRDLIPGWLQTEPLWIAGAPACLPA